MTLHALHEAMEAIDFEKVYAMAWYVNSTCMCPVTALAIDLGLLNEQQIRARFGAGEEPDMLIAGTIAQHFCLDRETVLEFVRLYDARCLEMVGNDWDGLIPDQRKYATAAEHRQVALGVLDSMEKYHHDLQ